MKAVTAVGAALVAVSVGLAGCKGKGTYVHVEILPAAGGEPAPITDLQVNADLAGKSTTLHLSEPGHGPIQFPTDVTLQLKSGAGQLVITIIASNAAGAEVDRATSTVTAVGSAITEATVQLPGGKPDIQPSETAHDFGALLEGNTANASITIHNAGFKPSGALSAAIGGAGASFWSITTDACSGSTLAAGGNCSVALQFKPIATGALAATLTVTGLPGGSAVVALTGTGTANPQTLTVTLAGSGGGSVVSSETPTPKISCSDSTGVAQSGTCTATYDYGTTVTLTATADSISFFNGGSIVGAPPCSGNPCTFTMTSNVSASVIFDHNPVPVNVSFSGSGSGSVSDTATAFNCSSPGPCVDNVAYNSTVTLTAAPATASGSIFTSWNGCTTTSGPTCTIQNVTASTSVTATLTQTYTVAVTAGGNGSGTVTSDAGDINCTITSGVASGTCSATVATGLSRTLTATRTSGSMFTGWSGSCSGSSTCGLSNITADQSVTTSFVVSFCPASVAVGQSFSSVMQGCPAGGANATFASRACGAGAHVCNSNEWVANMAGIAPLHHYWTDDALNYSAAAGACGPASCGPGNCFVSTGNTYTFNCGATTPMRVCTGTGAAGVKDPEGNTCNWTGCGFNSVSPSDYFGGCAGDTTAGTLCCSGTHQYFVNASTGNDSNLGTSASPFKTVTHALGVAVSGDTVFVKPGVYNRIGNAETFPLIVPANVALIGDEPGRGGGAAPTTLIGFGLANGSSFIGAVVVPGAGATVAGFTITTTPPPSGQFGMGIYPSASGAIIRNNIITGNQSSGIYVNVSGSTNHVVVLNSMTGNSSFGLVNRTIPGGKAENNTITGNGYGVDFEGGGVDLGGGPANSVGNNVLSCNTNSDFWTNSASSIFASNNKWDHVPPTSSTTSASSGIDIYNAGGVATINMTGASLAPNPCPACSASAVSSQVFDGTMIGCGGAVAFASRATLCPSYCHVCSASEWLSHHGTIAPTHNFYTNDLLGYSNTSPICLSTSGPNFCSTSSEGPGGVCAATQPDPEGNKCNNPNHALCPDTTNNPNQFFGACNGVIGTTSVDRSGALCCCP